MLAKCIKYRCHHEKLSNKFCGNFNNSGLSAPEESVNVLVINRAEGATIISDLAFDSSSRMHS